MNRSTMFMINIKTETQSLLEILISLSLKFLIVNIKSIVSNQLTSKNYPMWISQIPKFKENGYAGFLDGSTRCLRNLVVLDLENTKALIKFNKWMMIDQNLTVFMGLMISSMILSYVLHLYNTSKFWCTLVKNFMLPIDLMLYSSRMSYIISPSKSNNH